MAQVGWLLALLLVCPGAAEPACPSATGAPGSSLHVSLNLSHPIFAAASLHPGLVYQGTSHLYIQKYLLKTIYLFTCILLSVFQLNGSL